MMATEPTTHDAVQHQSLQSEHQHLHVTGGRITKGLQCRAVLTGVKQTAAMQCQLNPTMH